MHPEAQQQAGNHGQQLLALQLVFTAYVSGANTVTAVLANNTAAAVDLASGTLKVRVEKR